MKKEYWLILIAYTAMQFLGLIAIPLIAFFGVRSGKTLLEAEMLAVPIWIVASFTVTLLFTLYMLRNDIKDYYLYRHNEDKTSKLTMLFWAFAGVFLALFAQSIAIQIEQFFGIKAGSENTQVILKLIEAFPIVIIITSIVGPILEEIVFRKIIFGTLYKRVNFFIAALISSVIFAVAHNELEHTLLYTAMGMVFAFLYIKTKRIIVPIIAHVSMNTFVVLVQSVYYDDINKMLEELEQMQLIIGGF